jgi:glutamate synthase domain-containing protein 3
MTGGVAYVTGHRDEIQASCHADVVLDDVADEDWGELARWIRAPRRR